MENNQEIKDESLNNEGEQKDFQFYKQKLQVSVKESLQVDDEIFALNKALKERRDRKKKLSEYILTLMKEFEIHNMNINNGKLIYSVTKRKEPITRKSLINTLNLYFNDSSKGTEVGNYVMANRKTIEKVQLKRKKFNKTNN